MTMLAASVDADTDESAPTDDDLRDPKIARVEQRSVNDELTALRERRDLRTIEMLPKAHPDRVRYQELCQRKERAEKAVAASEKAEAASRLAAAVSSPAECRAALRTAITAQAGLQDIVTQRRAAIDQATLNERAAQKRLDAAIKASDRARAEFVELAERAAKEGRQPPASCSLRTVEDKVADARAAQEAAHAALVHCQVEAVEPEQELVRAKRRTEAAADAVIRAATSVSELVEAAKAVRVDLIHRCIVFRYLLRESLLDPASHELVERFLRQRNMIPPAPGDIEYVDYSAHPAAKRLEGWREALTRDADAPAPI
jgi:chromosome segregation ATPase